MGDGDVHNNLVKSPGSSGLNTGKAIEPPTNSMFCPLNAIQIQHCTNDSPAYSCHFVPVLRAIAAYLV